MSDDEDSGEEEVKKKDPNSIKLVAVGDGTVGKTCMLTCFATNKFPEDYIPTVFDSSETSMEFAGKVYKVGLWDTAGQSDFDRIRHLSYNGADVFLVCYSVVSPPSLEHIETKWSQEVKHFEKNCTIVVVGTKTDLDRSVDEKDGRLVAQRIGAKGYIECSAKTQENLKEVFELSVKIALEQREKGGGGGGGCCTIL